MTFSLIYINFLLGVGGRWKSLALIYLHKPCWIKTCVGYIFLYLFISGSFSLHFSFIWGFLNFLVMHCISSKPQKFLKCGVTMEGVLSLKKIMPFNTDHKLIAKKDFYFGGTRLIRQSSTIIVVIVIVVIITITFLGWLCPSKGSSVF